MPSEQQLETFVKEVQDAFANQATQIKQLQNDLAAANKRLNKLEAETAHVRKTG